MKQKVLVLGASLNPARYANIATNMLLDYGHDVYLLGLKEGEIRGVKIETSWPQIEQLDTITLYLGPKNQTQYYDQILHSGARRVIFNPGTENVELEDMLTKAGIFAEVACTLVLLRSEQFTF